MNGFGNGGVLASTCALALLLNCGVLVASPNVELMPGLTYYVGTEQLVGKFVFLVQKDYTVETNGETSASIYEFNLSQKQLKKVTDCPNGQFVPSFEGRTFCVTFWHGTWDIGKDTNLFVYSKILDMHRVTNVESSPQATLVVGDDVFIKLRGYNFKNAGYYLTESNIPVETKLLDYDVANNQVKHCEFSESRWQSQQVGGFRFKSSDGRYIFFEGKNAPIQGTKLVSSPSYPDGDEESAEDIKPVHDFARYSLLSGAYELLQLSPDRHYAFVRLINPITKRKYSEWPGSKNTYYLVDIKTGKTREVFHDDSESTTRKSISTIWWVE